MPTNAMRTGRKNEPLCIFNMKRLILGMPTFVAMTGVEPPEGYRTGGLSLLEFLKGGGAPERDYFYWELHEGGGAKRAARWGDWKAVMPKPMGKIEIYDLTKDIADTSDLAADRPELVERAKEIFAEAHTPHPAWPLDRASDLKKQASSRAQFLPENEAKHVKGSGGRVLWKEEDEWFTELRLMQWIDLILKAFFVNDSVLKQIIKSWPP